MSRYALRVAALLLFITGVASNLPAQTDPEFVLTVNPSIVTITQGGTATLTVHVAVNERPTFEFSLTGLPAGVVAQIPAGRAGATTILLTALPTAATGSLMSSSQPLPAILRLPDPAMARRGRASRST